MVRADLPTGTVTFLFTDVEGSTRLLQQHGAAYADLLGAHRRSLRQVFEEYGGVEVDTQGDAFFVAFPRATDAAAAAAAGRLALEPSPIRVRMGIHTGEPTATDEGYVGIDVHRAARVAAAGHGGQIILTESTRRLLDPRTLVKDLGEHRLKDLAEREHLYQLGDGDFASLRTMDATNLPLATSGLIGRDGELAELLALLSNGTRLVTITGPGGTGKTRLALDVAAELVGSLQDGVFWMPLAGLMDSELFPAEIARTIGAPDDLVGFLRSRELLLVLDNFEHMLDAAPQVSALLAASSRLRVLVTSRSRLRLSGEREYRLEPLRGDAAAALFVARARDIGRDLVQSVAIDSICRRLDGLPLAIELAAARTKLLTPEVLLQRLGATLPILTGGARDAPERQRTLRATIDWSYELLDEESRELLARLAVFIGGFPLEAAEEVCDATFDSLEALIDLSLLKPIGENRFLMLNTIREYALERLHLSGNSEELERRHAAFFGALAEQGYAHRFDREAEWSARLTVDLDDLRAALDWLASNDAERSLSLAGALGWFWLTHGHLAEGRARLAGALSASTDDGAPRARALTGSGAIVARVGDGPAGRGQLEEAIAIWRGLGDLDEVAAAFDTLGWLLFYTGQDTGALEPFERSLELRRQLHDAAGETRALVGVCQVHVALGQIDRAESLSRELLAMAEGEPRTTHFALHFLADCALIRGDTMEAGRRYRESLQAALPLGDVLETSFEVQGVAMAAAGNGDPKRALRLAGAVEGLWESLGTSISATFWDALLERYLGPARTELGDGAAAIWAEGRALAFDDAVALALTH